MNVKYKYSPMTGEGYRTTSPKWRQKRRHVTEPHAKNFHPFENITKRSEVLYSALYFKSASFEKSKYYVKTTV